MQPKAHGRIVRRSVAVMAAACSRILSECWLQNDFQGAPLTLTTGVGVDVGVGLGRGRWRRSSAGKQPLTRVDYHPSPMPALVSGSPDIACDAHGCSPPLTGRYATSELGLGGEPWTPLPLSLPPPA